MAVKPRFDGEWVRLAESCELVMGQSPVSSSYNTDGIGLPFYQGNADFGEVSPVARVWCTDPKKVAQPGDILISVRAPIGAINIAAEKCCIGRGLAAIRPIGSNLDVDYLVHLFRASRHRIESMGTGSTFKAVGKKALSELLIPVYCQERQREIAFQLTRIIECIRASGELANELDSVVKSRFVEMFGDPSLKLDVDNRVEIGAFADVQTGATPSRKRADFYGGTIPWIKTGEVARGFANGVEESITDLAIQKTNCKIFSAGSVLIAMYGQGNTRGKSNVLPFDAATNQACAAVLPSDKHDPVFLNTQLGLLYEELRGKSLGGNQKNLSLGIVKATKVLLPPLSLQQEFAAFAAEVDKSRFVVRS